MRIMTESCSKKSIRENKGPRKSLENQYSNVISITTASNLFVVGMVGKWSKCTFLPVLV